ncbi:MAG: glycoside hydrolase family 3 C-terminal domain-containing protein [Bacteroidales bacterium]|nr:glycoside hydrolase family 3 C-terminal domain-containing protein [Bacteroidales bacterium]
MEEEKRIESIVSGMSLEEKIAMLYGKGLFVSEGIPRLGIKEINYTDGPFGIREELEFSSWTPLRLTTDSATFLPAGSALAATWNPALAHDYGRVLGEEAVTRGKDVLLGPAVNITRSPLNGRTYEYMSEDPYLNSRLVVEYVRGVQACGVASCVKHYALNNQETNRGSVDVLADERTVREIYLPPFRAAIVEAGAWSVMAAYNKFRGDWCAENDYLLNKVLRDEWGFRGMVISDWGGTHSTVAAALNGLDVEMGSSARRTFFGQPLLDSVKAGVVPVSVIDDKVRRILRVRMLTDKKTAPETGGMVATDEHMETAWKIASEAVVLLKNDDGLLPVSTSEVKKIAVIGDNATMKHATGGFGAGVKTRYEVSPLEGLKDRIGDRASISFARGYVPGYLPSAGRGAPRLTNDTPDAGLLAEAVAAAREADVVLFFAGTNREYETEGTDRTTLDLPFGQNEVLKAVTQANPSTIVILVSGSPFDINTIVNSASSILWSGFNGSEGGNAIADVILGNVNPSGKLPFTFPAALEDSPAHALDAFPGDRTVTYSEGILVGYRWFDTKNIKPLFCFGHGLSYSSFSYSRMKAGKKVYGIDEVINLSLKIKNTGSVAGAETVQVYVSDMNPGMEKADRELKAFRKITIPAGKTVRADISINVNDLACWDEKTNGWVIEPGDYLISAGSSSRDLRSSVNVTVR